MSEKRRDNRGRILHNGEMQMPDGRYTLLYTFWWQKYAKICVFYAMWENIKKAEKP